MPESQDSSNMAPDLSRLESEITGVVGLPGSPIFHEATQVFCPPARHRRPQAVIRPAGTDDLAAILRRAATDGYRVTVRSGGHSFDGFPIREDAVLLDLSGLNEARLDSDRRLHAGPGARILDLAKDLDASGCAVPTGDCPTVGLGGLVSGGGFGYATRKLGLTTDNLMEAVVVTGSGEIHRVSRSRSPDLFWMCQGGAGTAAIMTEIVLRTFPVERVTAAEITMNWEYAREVIVLYDAVMRSAPLDLDLKLKFRTTGPDRFMDMASEGPQDAVPGEPLVHIDGQYLGNRQQAEALLSPLLDHPAVVGLSLREESYFEAMTDLIPLSLLVDPAPETIRPTRVTCDFVAAAIGQGEADALVRFVEEIQYAPEMHGGGLLIEPCDGVVGQIASDQTAYPHRDQRMVIEWELFHPLVCTSEQISRMDECLSSARSQLSHAISGGRYVNYADRLDTPSNWWLGNKDRLETLAGRFDPQGVIVSRLRPGPDVR
ncbi:FAD-binding oxidoreductase [Hoeflea sp. WL0058]|uniref:FAD-binding oxidoreductase n=1 Tax=Flavimaribacter sediminis TaxID=2865987 RepID=A0AAE3CZP8_9HYPH|nr:FAD-binding oxidoreductase [Flavimaribacter sediminis]MBW8636909.1 FAD-binding oxidoreductase [Flavimaribacter sediminis]